MVEVVEVGNQAGKDKRDYRAKCWRCQAVFRFNSFDTFDDPIENGNYMRCPQCWAFVDKSSWISENR